MKEDLVRIVARLYTLKDEIEDNNTRQKLELEETIDDLERMILDDGQEKDLEEIAERAKWVCSICGKNTFDVENDYIGQGTNHLGCELESEPRIVDDAGVDIETGKATFPGIDAIQKQAYNEMTADGLPPGGDAQAVLESHKLAEEIVNAKDGDWIYESPDGGKTVFRPVSYTHLTLPTTPYV